MSTLSLPRASLGSLGRAAVAWWVGELAELVPQGLRQRRTPFAIDVRADRWVLRRRGTPIGSFDPTDAVAVGQAWETLRGKGRRASVTLVVQAASCFSRETTLPRAMLGQAHVILAGELEANTPFQADMVYWDWGVRGPGVEPGSLRVQQFVLKRRDLAAIRQSLAAASIDIKSIAVDDPAAPPRRLAIDLLRGERSAALLSPAMRTARQAAIGGTVLASLAIVPVAFSRQASTSAALDGAIEEATDRLASHPGPGRGALTAIGNALAAKRRGPTVPQILDALAGALPLDSSLDHLFLDADVVTIQGHAGSMPALMRGLASSPLFIAGHNSAAPDPQSPSVPFTVRLKTRSLNAETADP